MAYVPFLEARALRVRVRGPIVWRAGATRRFRALRFCELVRDLAAAARSDVVVIYRKTFPGVTARILRRVARRVVFEFDDAIFLPAPSEPQTEESKRRYRRNFLATAEAADLVVAGNQFLAAEVSDRPVEVLPTGVDLAVFTPPARSGDRPDCTLGWIGTAENLPQWQSLVPAFRRVMPANPGVRLKVVSDRHAPECDFPVEFERFSIERQAACLESFDVGLMPLEDTPWNRGKCGLKALQCMAMGQPVVVSPVGVNQEIVEAGVNGAFATTEDEWVTELLRLAADAELRTRMGRAARATVERSYSLEQIGARMADLVMGLVQSSGETPRVRNPAD